MEYLLIGLLFIIAMTYLKKFRQVMLILGGIAAVGLAFIFGLAKIDERNSLKKVTYERLATQEPEHGPWEKYQAAQKQVTYERTSCCYRGFDVSKFGGADRKALEDAIDAKLAGMSDEDLMKAYHATKPSSATNPFEDLIPKQTSKGSAPY